jgi:Leucine-rich repeat (LRR) protein
MGDLGKPKHGNAHSANKRSPSPDKYTRTQQMTTDHFLTCSSLVRLRNETKDAFLRRLTHLQLQNQRFGAFEKLETVPGVQVMYVYENRIASLNGLENLRNLQQLFMQNNLVKSLQGLESLPHLRKLHLGHNQLRHIDSLESCKKLEELRVSYQHVDSPMTFCPKSIATIAPTLQVLEVAGNRIPNLLPLVSLTALQQLDASDNLIDKVLDCRELLESARGLTRVDLKGNPFASNERKYRAIIVLCCEQIELIDEKEVSASERAFIRKLEEQKLKARRSPGIPDAKAEPSAQFPSPTMPAPAMKGGAIRKVPSGKVLR